MEVRLIRRIVVQEFALKNPDCRAGCRDWLSKMSFADWDRPEDIQDTFMTADFLGKDTDRVVFSLCEERIRIITRYVFLAYHIYIYIKWIGPKEEYQKLCSRNLQFSIDE